MFKPTSQPGTIRQCDWCQQDFTANRNSQTFCNRLCKNAKRKHDRRFIEGWKEPDYHKPKEQ